MAVIGLPGSIPGSIQSPALERNGLWRSELLLCSSNLELETKDPSLKIGALVLAKNLSPASLLSLPALRGRRMMTVRDSHILSLDIDTPPESDHGEFGQRFKR